MIDLSLLQKNSMDFQKFCKQNSPFLVSQDLRNLGICFEGFDYLFTKKKTHKRIILPVFYFRDASGTGLLRKRKINSVQACITLEKPVATLKKTCAKL